MHLRKSIIEVYLNGGLGNQMFQWSAGYSLAKKLNLPITLNVSRLGHRDFELSSFDLGPYEVSNKKSKLDDIHNVQLLRLLRIIGSQSNYFERNLNFEPRFLEVKKPVKIHGFFQSKDYFTESFFEIKNKLTQIIDPSLEYLDFKTYFLDYN
jgi:hypothetical protein